MALGCGPSKSDGDRRVSTRARFRAGHFPPVHGVSRGRGSARPVREALPVRQAVGAGGAGPPPSNASRRAGTVTPFAVSPAGRAGLSRLQCDVRSAIGPMRSRSWRMIVTARRGTPRRLAKRFVVRPAPSGNTHGVVEGEDARRRPYRHRARCGARAGRACSEYKASAFAIRVSASIRPSGISACRSAGRSLVPFGRSIAE